MNLFQSNTLNLLFASIRGNDHSFSDYLTLIHQTPKLYLERLLDVRNSGPHTMSTETTILYNKSLASANTKFQFKFVCHWPPYFEFIMFTFFSNFVASDLHTTDF